MGLTHTPLSQAVGSYVINPFAVRVLCVFGGDGATRGKICQPPGVSDSCLPACMPNYDAARRDSRNAYDAWCDTADHPGAADYFCEGHPWRPSEIGTMLQRDREATRRGERRDEHHSYNEIVIDGQHYNAHLPSSVEAFVVGEGDDLSEARKLHRRFLDAFRLSEGEVPLLHYRPERDGRGSGVFTIS